MAFIVQFLDLAQSTVAINADEVFGLNAVPVALLPIGIPAGTYVTREDGGRVAVQGTVLAVAAALNGPTASAIRGSFDDQGIALFTEGIVGDAAHQGPGDYLVALDGGFGLNKQPAVACTLDQAPASPVLVCAIFWAGPDSVQVIIENPALGVPVDAGFSVIVSPT